MALMTLPLGAQPALRAVIVDSPPYGIADGRMADGAYAELLRRLAQRAGLAVQVDVLPFARISAEIGRDPQAVTLLFSNDALDAAAQRLLVVASVDAAVQPGPGRRYDSAAALEHSRIGRLRGGCQDIARIHPGIQFEEVTTQNQGVRMLLAGRIDGFCSTRAAIQYALRVEGAAAIHLNPPLVTSRRDVWLYVSPAMPDELQGRLMKAVQTMLENGEVRAIMLRWGEPGSR